MTFPSFRTVSGLSPGFGSTLAALLLAQAVVWIGLPLLLDGAIRLDVAEGVVDGPEWQLSYFRHPPLSSWLTGIASTLGPYRYAALYAFGFALASGAFALVAAFISRRNSSSGGLIALAAGLSSPYATYVPLEFNHNIGQMPFGPRFSLVPGSRSKAAPSRNGRCCSPRSASACGLNPGRLHLVAPLGLLFFATPEWRRKLWTPGPWIALAVAAAIVAPHFVDVARKSSTTLQFATRTAPAPFGVCLARAGEFALDAALAQVSMALIALAASGARPLLATLRAAANPRSASRIRPLLARRRAGVGGGDICGGAARRPPAPRLAYRDHARLRGLVGTYRRAGRRCETATGRYRLSCFRRAGGRRLRRRA